MIFAFVSFSFASIPTNPTNIKVIGIYTNYNGNSAVIFAGGSLSFGDPSWYWINASDAYGKNNLASALEAFQNGNLCNVMEDGQAPSGYTHHIVQLIIHN
jgi:hypothetical protein